MPLRHGAASDFEVGSVAFFGSFSGGVEGSGCSDLIWLLAGRVGRAVKA
ncbi:MAG: hypothetical protein AAGN15_04410 [Cyanobacteria bacterium J06581_3]